LKQNEDSSSSSEEEMANEDLLSKKLSIQGERYFKAVKGSVNGRCTGFATACRLQTINQCSKFSF